MDTAVVITRATGRPYLDAQGYGPGGRPLAFAHRGGATHPDLIGLENTMFAFRHAAALGYRYLETDVHLTREGVLIAVHDAWLDRVTDRSDAIAELDWAQIQQIRIGGREPIPTLAELFDEFPQMRFNIDLKAAGTPEALARFLAARNAEDRVLVGSFSARRINRFRRLTQGRVATSAVPWEVACFVLLGGRVGRWLSRGRVDALQIPYRFRGIRILAARTLRSAHRAGVPVHVWTIDSPDQIRELLDLGVDGVMTDRTDVLKDVLSERGLWKG